ncbi:metal-sensing transcriptional repressor [Streptomyces cellostaticus]|nr:metal-sensing transcriptional repressor [Streptomyces cellostaticus]GHI10084.1 hypothetical protein Scel_84050 [Streptomyces cellostaticus]
MKPGFRRFRRNQCARSRGTYSYTATGQHTQAPGYADHLARLDKITQVSAATRALQEVALGLLDDHVRGCVTNAARADAAQAEENFAELTDTLRSGRPRPRGSRTCAGRCPCGPTCAASPR